MGVFRYLGDRYISITGEFPSANVNNGSTLLFVDSGSQYYYSGGWKPVTASGNINTGSLTGILGVPTTPHISGLTDINPTGTPYMGVLGYYSGNDGGGGLFWWKSDSLLPVNSGTVFSSNYTTTGRWHRLNVERHNIKHFGALDNQDSTLHVKNALMLSATGGIPVYVPSGVFLIKSSLDIPSNIHIIGDGSGSIIKASGDFRPIVIDRKSNVRLENFKIKCISGSTSQAALRFASGFSCTYENIIIETPALNGIEIASCSGVHGKNVQIWSPNTFGHFYYDSVDCSDTNFYIYQPGSFGHEFKNSKRCYSYDLKMIEPLNEYALTTWVGFSTNPDVPGSKLCEDCGWVRPYVKGASGTKNLVFINASPRIFLRDAVLVQHPFSMWGAIAIGSNFFYNEGQTITGTILSGNTVISGVSDPDFQLKSGSRIHLAGSLTNHSILNVNLPLVTLTSSSDVNGTGLLIGFVANPNEILLDNVKVVGANCFPADNINIAGTSGDPLERIVLNNFKSDNAGRYGLTATYADVTINNSYFKNSSGLREMSLDVGASVVANNTLFKSNLTGLSNGVVIQNGAFFSADNCIADGFRIVGYNALASGDRVAVSRGVIKNCQTYGAIVYNDSTFDGVSIFNNRNGAAGFDGQIKVAGSNNTFDKCRFDKGGSNSLDCHVKEFAGASKNNYNNCIWVGLTNNVISQNNLVPFTKNPRLLVGSVPSFQVGSSGEIVQDDSFRVSRFNNTTITKYENLITFNSGTGPITGAAKLTLPNSWSNTMLTMRMEGYNHSSGTSAWEAYIGGYCFDGAGAFASSWVNQEAKLSPGCPFGKVRLGNESGKLTILLGESGTVWQFPKIHLAEVVAGHLNTDIWATGYTLLITPSITGVTGLAEGLINRNFQIKDGNEGSGKILVSDSSGYASWVDLSNLTGIGGAPSFWDTGVFNRNQSLNTVYLVPSGDNVNIGGYTGISAPYKLTVGGNQKFKVTDSGILFTEDAPRVSRYNFVGGNQNFSKFENVIGFSSGAANVVGAIKITLPNNWSDTMMTMRVEGYNWDAKNRWEVQVGGYNSTAVNWSNTSAVLSPGCPFGKVRLGNENQRCVLLIGDSGTQWSFPKFHLKEFLVSHTNIDIWTGGYVAFITSDITGVTGVVDLTINKTFQIKDGTEASGRILGCDASGYATWINPNTLSGFSGLVGSPGANTTSTRVDIITNSIISGQTPINFSGFYRTGGNNLYVYSEGILQRRNPVSGVWDNDYLEFFSGIQNITSGQIAFSYALASGTLISMQIFN